MPTPDEGQNEQDEAPEAVSDEAVEEFLKATREDSSLAETEPDQQGIDFEYKAARAAQEDAAKEEPVPEDSP